MQIDEILNSIRTGENALIPDSWAQGRTTFGGLTAAILCQAAYIETDSARRLRNFEIGFVQPLEAQEPYAIETEILANGKTVTVVSVRILQRGSVRALARADYVLPIPSQVRVDTFVAPKLRPINESIALAENNLPNFYRHFEGYIATEGIPFSGQEVPELGGWLRFKQPPKHITPAHLVCLIDAFPPTVSPHYKKLKPLSTVSWSIHFAHSMEWIDISGCLGYHAKVNFCEHGISSSNAEIWSPEGNLLANSVQTTLIYG